MFSLLTKRATSLLGAVASRISSDVVLSNVLALPVLCLVSLVFPSRKSVTFLVVHTIVSQ